MTQAEALEILQAGHNVFITGAAGSGKTHLLNTYIDYLKVRGVEPGITATTGLAATHLGGQTIHAWSGLGVRDTLSAYDLEDLESKAYLWKRLSRAEVLIIDEISMLHHFRLDLLDRIMRSFKRKDLPFGGIQVILCGDFFQLPPVARAGEARAKFAYRGTSWPELQLQICYLEEQHRQQDEVYLSILNNIRANRISPETLTRLKSRLDGKIVGVEPAKLYTHNVDVDRENERELAKLPGEPFAYQMLARGRGPLVETLKRGCLAPENLRLKRGARVMFVKNNYEVGYVNGTLGVVSDCRPDNITVRIASGKMITVATAGWRVEEEGKVKAEITQYPLRLAWAITVHKSQGLSLDAAEIDLSQSFEPGMGYVALSRVRSLPGLSLKGFNDLSLKVNEEVLERDTDWRALSRKHLLARQALSAGQRRSEQETFLRRVGAGAGQRPKKLDTYAQTKILLDEGKSLSEMATERGLTPETILDHLEKIKDREPTIPLQYLSQNMPVTRAKKIRQALVKNGMVSGRYPLGPAKTALGVDFSYAEIRLVRLLMS